MNDIAALNEQATSVNQPYVFMALRREQCLASHFFANTIELCVVQPQTCTTTHYFETEMIDSALTVFYWLKSSYVEGISGKLVHCFSAWASEL